jgi:hypothetical protein
MVIWRMRIACRIPKATNTHSEYVLLIAFLLQQWLHERVSVSALLVNLVVLIMQRAIHCLFVCYGCLYRLSIRKS